MPDLLYLSLVRFPTEKAHGLQIAQNCEAFSDAGYTVRLWVAQRINTRAMDKIADPYQYYGVTENFNIEWLPCIDVYRLARSNVRLEKIAFAIQIISYVLVMWIRLLRTRADIYYSRDEFLLLALSLFIPRDKLVFEIHQFWGSRRSRWVQRQVARRVGHVIAITPRLAQDVIDQHATDSERVIVAHDGIRAARFENQHEISDARHQLGWPADAFIVGYVGRLHMLNVDKGVGTLIEALSQVDGVHFALVGGPESMVGDLRDKWLASGLPEIRFHYAGQVLPDQVPLYLSAFDVCAMPHPFTHQFAYYTSPLKLFEYMASGRAIVASDLPGWSDVITHEETALLVPDSDADALAQAVRRLHDDPRLRESLGMAARARVMQHYTWAARAQHIRAHIERATIASNE